MMNEVMVIIATALNRTNLLLERSLLSVYNQINIDLKQVKVVVVDDNEIDDSGLPFTINKIRTQISELRNKLTIPIYAFETTVIPNVRTKKSSGTGAWNTGLNYAYETCPEGYIAILDDDDEFLPHHISDCVQVISNDNRIIAVFQELIWKNHDSSVWHYPLSEDHMNELAFFIGNPGVQGSNMFFKTTSLLQINGFDETLSGSTDRDLLIRLFRNLVSQQVDIKSVIKIINSIGVIHHNHKGDRVTKTNSVKHKSLDKFYEKHRSFYPEKAYQDSLTRALKFFNYKPTCDA